MSYNLYRRLRNILPNEPLLVGAVTNATTYGATVELPGGSIIDVRGDATTGQNVFIRAGIIEGEAPALTAVLIDI